MGNKVPVDESYGKIEINLEKLTFTAGEQVNGWVLVSLVKPFLADTLYLIISGKERTKFVKSRQVHTDHGTHTVYDHYKGKNEFYEYLIPLYKHQSGFFPVGQYSFPFSFKLVQDLPGSFDMDYTSHGYPCYGKIKYKIKAGFKDPALKKTFFKKASFFLNQVWQSPSTEKTTHYEKHLKGYCYVNLGAYRIQAHFDKDKFFAGDNCSIAVEIDNTDAKRDAKNVKCQLVQNTRLQIQNSSVVDYVRNVLSEEILPGIPKGESRKGSEAFKIQLPIRTQNQLQASSSGVLVKNEFQLVISTELDACLCCRNHPHTEADIKIYNMPIELVPRYPVNNWNPQMIPLYVCPMGPDMKLTPEMKAQLYQ